MAEQHTVTVEQPPPRTTEPPPEERAPIIAAPPRISWGAVFGGAVASLALWALLDALGLALGLTPINPNDPESLRISGIFTGVWALVVPLIALFIGGFIAARGAGAITRGNGALHGLVMWALTTLAGLWLVGTIATGLVGGAMSVGQVVGPMMERTQQQPFTLDANAAVAPVNDRMREMGLPEVSAEEVQAAAQPAVAEAMRTGQVDRQALQSSLERNTSLARRDAQEVASRIEGQFTRSRGEAEVGALQAARATGRLMWGIFGSLALGLVAAVLGGLLGASRKQPIAVVQREPAARGA